MTQIKRYSVLKEEHVGDNVFKVHRGYIMGNPYTHIRDKKTKAEVLVKTREEAIERYKRYFEISLKQNPIFAEEFERMIKCCMENEEVFIGCYCHMNEECHGDYIVNRLRQECTKRMIQNLLKKRETKK